MNKKKLTLAVIAAACSVAAACGQTETNKTPLYTGEAHSVIVPASHEEMVKVAAHASDPRSLSFGPGVAVHVFKPSWGLTDSRIVGDDIYIFYSPDPSQTSRRLGVLRDGTLYPIFLRAEYSDFVFVDNNTGIVALKPNRDRDVYALKNGHAILTDKQSQQTIQSPATHTLLDGGTCADPVSGGSALDEIKNGRRSTLLTPEQLGRASYGILDVISDATCGHFNGKNYVAFGAPSVIFQLAGDKTKIMVVGWIDASSDKHMLIETFDGSFLEADVE